MRKLASAFVTLILFTFVTNSRALTSPTSVTYTGSANSNVKGEKGVVLKTIATFTVSNLDLVITLSNLSTNDARTPSDILTAIFFDSNTPLNLTRGSVTVPNPGNNIIGHRLPLGFDWDVSGQWAYNGDLPDSAPGDYGLSSTKFTYFKKGSLFSDIKIPGTSPLSGPQFGITTLNDMMANDQGSIKNVGLIQNTVQLVLDGLPQNFTLADITDVTFVYGTNIKKGISVAGQMVSQIPEPSTLSLVATGLVGALALVRSRTRRR
ncbi:MAG TPA: XDD4 family exosortase-dependent surface protein [Verrucomicrobiae bacterium]|nr:XDD4 family exosortase-dependent surface protein [Verrucomicrobiae bacterium]